jgi:hypothetical protein
MLVPCICDAFAIYLPCRCYVLAMSLACICHAVALYLPCCCLVCAMCLPCLCHGQRHGKDMARTGQRHGKSIAKTGQTHSKEDMTKTGQKHGKDMAKTWQGQGNKHGEGTVMRVRHIRPSRSADVKWLIIVPTRVSQHIRLLVVIRC